VATKDERCIHLCQIRKFPNKSLYEVIILACSPPLIASSSRLRSCRSLDMYRLCVFVFHPGTGPGVRELFLFDLLALRRPISHSSQHIQK
jgi:hypothetical protein